MTEGDFEDHVLVTKGVKSPVLEGVDGLPNEGLGHVGLLDWDDHVGIEEAKRLIDTHEIGGPTVVFESSPGNLHGWNLTVRSFQRTAVVLNRLNDDGKHRAVGESRGWWRLRAGPKVPADADDPTDTYKPSPEAVTVIDRPTDRPVSAPHLTVAEALAGETLIPQPSRTYELHGTTVLTAMYTTFKDLEKPVQRGAE